LRHFAGLPASHNADDATGAVFGFEVLHTGWRAIDLGTGASPNRSCGWVTSGVPEGEETLA